MAITMNAQQRVTVELPATDRRGNAAKVDTATFTIENEEFAIVEQDEENPLKAVVTSLVDGVTKLSYRVDADLDDDEERVLEGFIAIEIVPLEAVGLGELIVSEPTDI